MEKEVIQHRMVYVHGVGWYICDGRVPLNSFKDMARFINLSSGIIVRQTLVPPPPDFVSLVDWIQYFSEKQLISMDQCILLT